ncbi:DNA topoisomerase IV [Arenibacter sp. GZD96]|uniref:hypothetical protein n=1 Tax=Aurantibrevibacter litoralis TaxID=3106030 RepID=UPI002AFF2230|nr:hypothetical protein [Arenibacter sp. GZD-96]MEA1785373.1 DNA topoisomerase IV [Arenibacter sp. GZD-96]
MSRFSILVFLGSFFLLSCYEPSRNCSQFKNGTFTFTTTIDGEAKTTTFRRNEGVEIEVFEGERDTADVRWINDCEYIVKKINPKSIAEGKAIHIKILSTTADAYTFEYGLVGSSAKTVGTAIKSK